jgi:hypothetical protein
MSKIHPFFFWILFFLCDFCHVDSNWFFNFVVLYFVFFHLVFFFVANKWAHYWVFWLKKCKINIVVHTKFLCILVFLPYFDFVSQVLFHDYFVYFHIWLLVSSYVIYFILFLISWVLFHVSCLLFILIYGFLFLPPFFSFFCLSIFAIL